MLKGILKISMIMCLGCQSTSNNDVFVDVKTTPIVVASEKTQDVNYKVRVEIVLAGEDIGAYPELFETFIKSVQEWANVIPIEAIIMVPEIGNSVTTQDIRNERDGVVRVNFSHNILSNNNNDDNNLGIWYPSTRIICLDLDDMYKDNIFNEDLARAVSLHELGHMFGLPHIGNAGELIIEVGDITVTSGAELMMMHPTIPKDLKNIVISKMEADLARRYMTTAFLLDSQDF
jgi:predicted Zn-dependent protease